MQSKPHDDRQLVIVGPTRQTVNRNSGELGGDNRPLVGKRRKTGGPGLAVGCVAALRACKPNITDVRLVTR